MSRFDRMTVLNTMLDLGVIPVFYHADFQVARTVVAACVAGGARVIEFTNRGDFAPQVFFELARHFAQADPRVILGVGSIVDAPTAALYIAYGASFVVGPNLNPEVARLCNRRKIPYAPGCGSASEIAPAEELGCEIVKVFPGGVVGGPEFVKTILGPCPWTRLMPTGGVDATEESLTAWFKAGVACVGMGSNLITRELVQAGNDAEITRRVAQALLWARQARGLGLFTGVEHLGVYHGTEPEARCMAEWYERLFSFKVSDRKTAFFAAGTDKAWLEIVKQFEYGPDQFLHIGIAVRDFDLAVAALQAQGIVLEEPVVTPAVKLVYLKDPDPSGNKVHLVWRP